MKKIIIILLCLSFAVPVQAATDSSTAYISETGEVAKKQTNTSTNTNVKNVNADGTVVTTLSTTGNSKKEKNAAAIRKRMKSFLKAVKKYDQKKINASFVPRKYRSDIYYIDKGYYLDKFIRARNKKYFKYSIKSISAGKTTGTAKVRITYYDGYDLCTAAFWSASAYMAAHPSYSVTDKSVYKLLNKYVRAKYRYYEPSYYLKTVTIKVPFKKINGKWKISKMSRKLNDAVNCSFCTALLDL